MEEFGSGQSLTSVVPSLQMGVTLCAGPVAATLVDRLGCRPTAAAGSVLAAAGIAVSGAADNLPTLYLTAGLCTGSQL